MKRILFVLMLWLAMAGVAPARTASEAFTAAPDRIVRLLPQSTRLDMLDYFNYGSTRASDNYFGGKSRITAVTDAAVSFQVGEAVDMQIAVIPRAKADTVFAVVTTIALPAADSSVDFYDTDWRPLKKPLAAMPAYDDWVTAEGKTHIDELRLHLPFMPVQASVSPDGHRLVLTNSAPEFLAKSQTKEFSAWLITAKEIPLD